MMRSSRIVRTLTIASTALSLGGCALLSKSDPLTPRYFSPEPSGARAHPTGVPRLAPAGDVAVRELRLGRIAAASYLGERLVFRDSSYELGFYEDRRWTEKPEVYVRRALSRALFESGAIRRVVSGASPTLDVELVELAELRAPTHVARVRATYVLYDARAVRAEASVSVDLPIPAAAGDKEAPEAVRVLAEGLTAVVEQIVARVTAELDASRAPEAAPRAEGAASAIDGVSAGR